MLHSALRFVITIVTLWLCFRCCLFVLVVFLFSHKIFLSLVANSILKCALLSVGVCVRDHIVYIAVFVSYIALIARSLGLSQDGPCDQENKSFSHW